MSAEKRPADGEPGTSQVLVKRQNVNNSEGALARLNASSNALVQTVGKMHLLPGSRLTVPQGSTNECSTGARDAVNGTLRRGIHSQVRPDSQPDCVRFNGQEYTYAASDWSKTSL